MSRVQNAGRNHNRKISNTSFERKEQLKNFGETLTNQNSIRVEIESIFNAGNTCCHSVLRLMSSVCYPNIQDVPGRMCQTSGGCSLC